MMKRSAAISVVVALTGASIVSAHAPEGADPVTFRSLGQPPLVKPYVAGSFT